jgi:hypothetical protein
MEREYIKTQAERYGKLNVLCKLLDAEYENIKIELPFDIQYYISREDQLEKTKNRIKDMQSILYIILEELGDIECSTYDINLKNFGVQGEILGDTLKRMKGESS